MDWKGKLGREAVGMVLLTVLLLAGLLALLAVLLRLKIHVNRF